MCKTFFHRSADFVNSFLAVDGSENTKISLKGATDRVAVSPKNCMNPRRTRLQKNRIPIRSNQDADGRVEMMDWHWIDTALVASRYLEGEVLQPFILLAY